MLWAECFHSSTSFLERKQCFTYVLQYTPFKMIWNAYQDDSYDSSEPPIPPKPYQPAPHKHIHKICSSKV